MIVFDTEHDSPNKFVRLREMKVGKQKNILCNLELTIPWVRGYYLNIYDLM